ncbi:MULTISPECIES: helix-turn-helix domain-containing protein [unclassified Pseudomonas]|uniref:helix-turn-helix domain-containing protein n=1 Tax=unclassified Pseudomonas TaxID=196821 RepID=UPI000D82A639|nr:MULTISPECIES: helix-turn-helix transcriptional regulator [unclassified Pseudomonas]PYG78479.1 transcriptional regulator with XRE-family HTH domain [Pseudomonas sp. RV120224-01c]PYG82579.1 transcriptional regulator with XRE-family HTH domain [Pseudomonas sp. RV120224-01b]
MPAKKPNSRHIGRQLAKFRNACKLTQEEVGERLQISGEAVSRMERGQVDLSVTKLLQLADIYQCSADELLLVASSRPRDQGLVIAEMLQDLSEADRLFAVDSLRQLATHLARR